MHKFWLPNLKGPGVGPVFALAGKVGVPAANCNSATVDSATGSVFTTLQFVWKNGHRNVTVFSLRHIMMITHRFPNFLMESVGMVGGKC